MSTKTTIEREIERLERRLMKLEEFSFLQELEEGTVISFTRRFSSKRDYEYVGIKKHDTWWLSGSGEFPNRFTDEALAAWLADKVVGDIWIATEWEVL